MITKKLKYIMKNFLLNYEKDKGKIFFSFCIIVVYTFYLFNYDISKQHDTWLHHQYIFKILNFDFKNINSEYGLFYYIYVSSFAILTSPLYFFDFLDPRTVFYLTIKLANYTLLLLTIYFLWNFLNQVLTKKKIFLLISILFSFAFFNRTFFMARPENLMIPISIVILQETYTIIKSKKINFYKFVFFLAIIAAQKVSGFIFASFILFFIVFFSSIKNKSRIIVYFIFLLLILYLNHYLITGVKFYQNSDQLFGNAHTLGIINNITNFDIFYNFSFFDAWNNPIRNSQKYSMINILSLDLIGDYWRYGIINISIYKNTNLCLILSNRNSIVFFIFFLILVLFSINHYFFDKKKMIFLLFSILPLVGIGVLIIAAFFRINLADSDIFKFEYISFFLIPFSLVMYDLYKKKLALKLIILFMIFLGLYNNLIPLHCLI